MKTIGLLLIAVSVFTLAAAVYLHTQGSETGRYEIASVPGLSGVYRVDTKTGDLSICSPLYENSCMTLEEAYLNIKKHQENMKSTAGQAVDKMNQFTSDRAQDLNKFLGRLGGMKTDETTQPAE